jgi:hypothetical protein
MEIITLVILIITAFLGMYLLTYVLSNKNTPKGIALIHGVGGALGIIFLALNVSVYPWLVLFFCLVALGGFTLIIIDLSGKKIPKLLALGHGFLAVVGILTLIYFLV